MIETLNAYGVESLPNTSRVWIFQSSKELEGNVLEGVSNILDTFLQQWAAHGQALFAAFEIRFKRFIVIAVDQNHAAASGCSIDSMMRCIQQIDSDYDLNLLDRMKVAYVKNDDVIECPMSEFQTLYKAGEVNANTLVFNNTVQTLADFKTDWKMPVSNSWHANMV